MKRVQNQASGVLSPVVLASKIGPVLAGLILLFVSACTDPAQEQLIAYAPEPSQAATLETSPTLPSTFSPQTNPAPPTAALFVNISLAPSPTFDWLAGPPTQAPQPTEAPPPTLDWVRGIAAATQQDMVLAHYMAWYKTPGISGTWQHWGYDPDGDNGGDPEDVIPDQLREDGRHEIASAHYPLFGPYDSSDKTVIEYHVASAWAAGIDGFVVDWYGPNDSGEIDRAFRMLLETVTAWREQYGLVFFVAITYEENILRWANISPEAQETRLEDHFRYILSEYAQNPSYLTFEGVPLIFYFQSWIDGKPGLLRPDQLDRVKRALPPFNLLYMGAESEFMDVSEGFFSWVSGANENPADWGESYVDWVYGEMDYRAERHDLKINIGGVWAGFDDSGVRGWGHGPRYIDPQGGEVYDQTWRRAVEAKAKQRSSYPSWVQIITWNDWNEGTEIEPSIEFGRQYLNSTQQYVTEFTGKTFPDHALFVPELIYRARLNQPGPATEATIQQVYELFFANHFTAALDLLQRSGLTS